MDTVIKTALHQLSPFCIIGFIIQMGVGIGEEHAAKLKKDGIKQQNPCISLIRRKYAALT